MHSNVNLVILAFGFTIILCNDVKGERFKCHFPSSNETSHPRLVLHRPISEMKEFTFCSWMKPYSFGVENKSTILSYSSSANIDELVLSIFSQEGHGTEIEMIASKLKINKLYRQVLDLGFWQHICVVWFNDDLSILIDGETPDVKNDELEESHSRKDYIPGGGKLVIGQRQKTHDTFLTDLAWYGSMHGIHLWDEILSVDEMDDVRNGHCHSGGNVINWMKSPMVAFDGVQISENDNCNS